DPAYHPYGALIYVDGSYDGAAFDRLFVAQDTGGAIRRGPLRGDVFWGTGREAQKGAERMNAPARWWTLLPRGVPIARRETARG
ncbi:MAG: 3D domain-containing protein, partial [Hyphomonadaceae bacterium]